MHKVQDLQLWVKAMDMVVGIYELSASFPADERFGLIAQIKRCAVSIPSNIAEGAGRSTSGEFVNFLSVANGSAYELQTQLTIAFRLNFISKEDYWHFYNIMEELQKMNYKLQLSLKAKNK